MIVLNLVCGAGHHFDGWFASVESFDDQSQRDLVRCPQCNARSVERLPSAPRIARHAPGPTEAPGSERMTARLIDRLGEVAERCEDVGERFPDEARRIHYHETDTRPIRGQASLSETLELLEEGIPVLPVPVRPKRH